MFIGFFNIYILQLQVRVPHQGGPLRGLLRRQQADRVWVQGQDHQAVEHLGSVQVHHPGRGPQRLGLLRQVQPQQPEPHHRLMRMG